MTKSLNRQGSTSDSSSPRGGSKRRQGSRRITAGQEKFLRKLLLVLSEIVDEKGQFDDDYNESKAPGFGSTRDKGEVAPRAELKSATTDGKVPFEQPNLRRFGKLCEELIQHIRHIQGSLNALGGGSRAAKALEKMQIGLNGLRESWGRYLSVTGCIHGFKTFGDAVEEGIAAFKELGVFNTRFFNALRVVERKMAALSRRLDHEYNFNDLKYPEPNEEYCYVDEYLDSLFSNVNENLDALISELPKVVEKDIATIRQTQDFSSQRYLNLTTISTFLSSVTATTLQITANGPSSILSTATNSLWFISLVFSTASAVYSLLIMTWRQSAIRPPDLCLLAFARAWLRNGPMFALIVALGTFSIGLCFLAFMVADQWSSVAPAALPVTFAGFHAYAICVLSAWFLFEQWKTRNTKAWKKVQDNWLRPARASAKNAIKKIKHCGSDARRMWVPPRNLFSRIVQLSGNFATDGNADDDVERGMPGHYTSEMSPPSSSIDNVESRKGIAVENLSSGNEPQHIGHREDEKHGSREAIETAPELADPESSVIDDLTHQSDALNESRLFNRTLQFSADCKFLASAFSNVVTIYDVERSFETLATIKDPGGHTVEQVAGPGDSIKNLLVRTTDGISVYEFRGEQEFTSSHYEWDMEATCLGQLEAAAKCARWVRAAEFSCIIDKSLKVFDRTCKELECWDLSRVSKTGSILDAILLQGNEILCLERARNGADYKTNLLMISRDNRSPVRRYERTYNPLSLAVSHAATKLVIYGGERWEVGTVDEWAGYFYPTYLSRRVENPVKALTLSGKADNLVMCYSEGEIFVWYHGFFSQDKIHTIRTMDSRALVQNPVAAAIGLGTLPYLFAFGAADGTVKIWSILSNRDLWRNKDAETLKAETFKVEDEWEGWKGTDMMGCFLVLPPPNLDVTGEQVPGSSQE